MRKIKKKKKPRYEGSITKLAESLTLLEPDTLPNFSGKGKLIDIIHYNHDGYRRMVAMISSGAYPSVVAEAFGITRTTFTNWLTRGQLDLEAGQDTIYSRFTCDIRRAIARCRIAVEGEITLKDPKFWLRYGPGKILSDDWADSPRKVDHSGKILHSVDGEINHSGTITNVQLEGSDLISVIRELANAGIIDLNERSHALLEHMPKAEDPDPLDAIDEMEPEVRAALLEDD